MKGLLYDLVGIAVLVTLLVFFVSGTSETSLKSNLNKIGNSTTKTINELVNE